MLSLYDLQTEYQDNPLGLDAKRPAFSWKLRCEARDTVQARYRIAVSREGAPVWDSGVVESDQSLYNSYDGEALRPRSRYKVQVSVWDNHGEKAQATGHFETGLMDWRNFEADFITHGFEDDLEPCAVFFREFEAEKPVAKARVYASALGIYAMRLNGRRVGNDFFAPGWTSYQERLQYQTYDITNLVQAKNRLEVTVGNGWWKGVLGFYGQGDHYGTRTALMAQIELTYADGTTDRIVTDETWTSTTGPHRYGEFYHGEVIDLSLPEQDVAPTRAYDFPKERLVAQESELVRVTQRVAVRKVLHSPAGQTILDFGQNLSGVVEARIHAPKGTRVVLRHGEALDENGDLYTFNLRSAKATDTFVCSGGDDVFMPEFTFHGFRYVAVEGLDDVRPEDFVACVLGSGFARAGSFGCANEDVNQLWRNIDWTMRSNYLDVPMDCNQRDERLGYTGDAQIFLPTALFHGNLALFYRKWLRDLRVEQTDDFGVPLSVPDILRTRACVSIWHDAAAIVPWLIWQAYGDLRVLDEQYESMRSSVEYSRRLAKDGGLLQMENSSQFGDWLALDTPKGPYRPSYKGEELHPEQAEKEGGTDPHLIGNAYYLYSIDILAQAAALLGKDDDAAEYRALYDEVLARFRAEYITSTGRLVTETQTAAALVLNFDLAEEKARPRILDQLVLNLIKTKKHLLTGFVGTQYLPHALSHCGRHQLAGDILLKDDCNSWLYEVKLGATTVWELWDGVKEDGSFNLFHMSSLNQYGFATIGDWLVKELAGMSSVEPGYRKSRIAPQLVRGIPSVSASHETPYGRLSCALACKDGRMVADITIPENTTAQVALPGRDEELLGSGTYHFDYATDLSFDAVPFSEDSTLRELMAHPAALELLEAKAPQLAHNPFVRNFASRMSIAEIRATIPQTMVPASAYPIIDEMIALLNKR